MKVLVDAALFQLAPEGAGASALRGILRELVGVAALRGLALTILDRGGMPPLPGAEVVPFPSFQAADAVADATLLQRMAESIGAGALVSTALTMPLLLPTVQLICGEDALTAGRTTASERTEGEIAAACSSVHVCTSGAVADAFAALFPRHGVRVPPRPGAVGEPPDRRTAMVLADAVAEAPPPFADADFARRFLALRRLQAAFAVSNG